MRIAPLLALLLAVAAGAAPAAAQEGAIRCLKLGPVTVFAPRGEVYVSVEADCKDRDFGYDSGILAYLEVVVDDQTVLGRDVRVEREVPTSRQTFAFQNVELVQDQPLLIRLTSDGAIISLDTVRVQ
jgi:hypothetical protein